MYLACAVIVDGELVVHEVPEEACPNLCEVLLAEAVTPLPSSGERNSFIVLRLNAGEAVRADIRAAVVLAG